MGLGSPENAAVLQYILENSAEYEEAEVRAYAVSAFQGLKSTANKIEVKFQGDKESFLTSERRRNRNSQRAARIRKYASQHHGEMMSILFPASRGISAEQVPSSLELKAILGEDEVFRHEITDTEEEQGEVQGRRRKRFRVDKPGFLSGYKVVEEVMDYLEEKEVAGARIRRRLAVHSTPPNQGVHDVMARFQNREA